MDLRNTLHWLPRLLSAVVVLIWILGVVVAVGFTEYFIPGSLIWMILVSTTLMAWKTEIFGGFLFLVLGVVFMIFIFGNKLSAGYYLASAPLFAIGALYITDYFYQEKAEQAEVEF
ncbi:hypothetical protein COV20_02470 [Candidatus Woesearchaeota archaeon CG10_big_fil_rev_8_21_14_0_10_45_16]|nr:MAG: hypothetical protein COV20_02470 [Candidatus Woesearchaeota archaeon CG10_big_fil_rev_8_21_14_0_10_45_16]